MSDWHHFFASIRRYLDYFRAHFQLTPSINGFSGEFQTVSDSELAGLLSWTRLATQITINDHESRRQMYEERSWNSVESIAGLLACPIPLILKGTLYKFLAALAADEMAAVNIWNSLLSEGICTQQMNGKLMGIQQDLEVQESRLKIYDCTEGFLRMVKVLLSHKTRPGTVQLGPYLQFVINSVLCNFSVRSYSNSDQMWELVKLSLDSLYEPLKTFYATPANVSNKVIEVQILAQLLTDSPLSRSLLQIIIEGADRLQDESAFCAAREDATHSALRLLYTAISHREALADAIRAVNSDILIASLESILFSAIPHPQRSNLNYISLLSHYLSESKELARHSLFVWRLLKEMAAQGPSLQPRVVQALLPHRAQLIASMANLSSIFSAEDISLSIADISQPDSSELLPADRLRGEICRIMFETFNDAMEMAPDRPNIAYALMNFDLTDIPSTSLAVPVAEDGKDQTCLHNLIEIAGQLALPDSFSQNYSGLFEPALRLILRLCSVQTKASALVLRFLRSQYDLIGRLANSQIFRRVDLVNAVVEPINLDESNGEVRLAIVQRSLQGIVLELIALELSSLIRMGLIEQPSYYLQILLSSTDHEQSSLPFPQSSNDSDLVASANSQPAARERAFLWILLEKSHVFVDDLEMPQLFKFDTQKVEELLSLCTRKNSCGIDQFDIVYLHLLLNSEINCILNSEIGLIREEARSILYFCVRKNARNLLEGACTHLLQGWLSVMNVLCHYTPLQFIEEAIQQYLLVDALFLLRDYCKSVEMSAELATSAAMCMSRIVRAMGLLFLRSAASDPNPYRLKENVLPVLHLLLSCIVLPGYSKSIGFKMELYASCLRTLDLCNHQSVDKDSRQYSNSNGITSHPHQRDSDLIGSLLLEKTNVGLSRSRESALANGSGSREEKDHVVTMVQHGERLNELWSQLIEPIIHVIVQTLSSDIIFAPLSLKVLSTATFIDVLREDIRHGCRMIREFSASGSLHCVADTLARLEDSLAADKAMEQGRRRRIEGLAKALGSLVAMARSSLRNSAF